MRSVQLSFLFLALLAFNGCTPKPAALFPKIFAGENKNNDFWSAFLIHEDEYPKDSTRVPIRFYPFLYSYQKSNPGFVDLSYFRKKLPDHPLAQLKRWYSSYFFQLDKTLSYTVMEFKDSDSAQAYLPHLRSTKQSDAIKILRYREFLICMQVRNRANERISKEDASTLYRWIQEKQTNIMSEL